MCCHRLRSLLLSSIFCLRASAQVFWFGCLRAVCRGEPGSLLYDLYEVMHIVFNIPVRFKGNLEGKVFVNKILKSHPIRCFLTKKQLY